MNPETGEFWFPIWDFIWYLVYEPQFFDKKGNLASEKNYSEILCYRSFRMSVNYSFPS